MDYLKHRRILLGISGGIAAYKSAELVRLLVKAGAEVRVVMTEGAKAFVTPLTFQALSGNPVHHQLLDETAEAGMGHIELARWADRILVAPATANLLARLTQGLADDLLTSCCLASEAPIYLAPAMNRVMWQKPATQRNIKQLNEDGFLVLDPDSGSQACGEVGPGRMLEPSQLLSILAKSFANDALSGTSVLITAGPTREAIDAVRFISNHSSGKMGFALARAIHEAGANVTLVSGPVNLETPAGVNRIDVETAEQMGQAVFDQLDQHQIMVGAAAVADYIPGQPHAGKLKKSADNLHLSLSPSLDIMQSVGESSPRPFLVGFAAETERLAEYAQDKRVRKQMDMIAANQVGLDDRGFGVDDNALSVFWEGGSQEIPLASKDKVARQLASLIAERYHASHQTSVQ